MQQCCGKENKKLEKPEKMMPAWKLNQNTAPCKDCGEYLKGTNFNLCGKSCEKMFKHLKKIFAKNCSPCTNLICGMPGVTMVKGERAGCKEDCPLPEIYAKHVGLGPKSVMGKTFTPYVTEWDIRHGVKY